MEQETSLLYRIKKIVLFFILFALPLFFLPFTQEFFITGKMYLLFFGSLLLLTLSVLDFLVTRKLTWTKKPLDGSVVLFFIAALLSIIISSPNKIQALLNPTFGAISLFSYVVLYFFFSRTKQNDIKNTLVYISSMIVSLVSLFYFFNPFKNVALPTALQFLKNPQFTPMGSQIDAALFLGFVAVMAFSVIFSKHTHESNKRTLPLVSFILSLIAIGTIIFSIVKTPGSFILPPFNLSWYAAVETLKAPLGALFGVGVDNYSAMFTKVKDTTYNSSSLWQIGSFSVARSTFLHVFTEMGLFGLLAFCLLMVQLVKKAGAAKKHHGNKYVLIPAGYVILSALLFPPSLLLIFLIFLLAIGVGLHEKPEDNEESFTLDTGKIIPLYVAVIVLAFLFIGASGYLVGRSYAAELYFKKSLDGIAKNNVKEVYDNMRIAVIINPYIERFRSNFSQTNLLIANNLAQKNKAQTKEGEKQPELSEQDRQTISQAIQAAIEEAKATVTLNPQKAANWENLAAIYRNIISVAQGADSWTVSAYQRAIILDPQNPALRVDLGGVLFSLKNYDEASKLFEQAVAIKPDWANSYYNLAWASYQKQDFKRAAAAMQNTVSLLDPKKDEADYKKATADLAEFKKKLPPEEEKASQEGELKSGKLSVPTPPAEAIEPKIQLPKEASPEAK